MKIKYTKTCTTVYDCYKYTNKEINLLGEEIYQTRRNKRTQDIIKTGNIKNATLCTRTPKSYSNEIKAHKRAYLIGYKRSHSKDCDCEENISEWTELKYRILGR